MRTPLIEVRDVFGQHPTQVTLTFPLTLTAGQVNTATFHCTPVVRSSSAPAIGILRDPEPLFGVEV
jgi:hypothetical protein